MMSADEYRLKPEEFPPSEVMRSEAMKCPLLAYCPDRPFSFCLKKWVNINHELMFRKVTFKHCYECQHEYELFGEE